MQVQDIVLLALWSNNRIRCIAMEPIDTDTLAFIRPFTSFPLTSLTAPKKGPLPKPLGDLAGQALAVFMRQGNNVPSTPFVVSQDMSGHQVQAPADQEQKPRNPKKDKNQDTRDKGGGGPTKKQEQEQQPAQKKQGPEEDQEQRGAVRKKVGAGAGATAKGRGPKKARAGAAAKGSHRRVVLPAAIVVAVRATVTVPTVVQAARRTSTGRGRSAAPSSRLCRRPTRLIRF